MTGKYLVGMVDTRGKRLWFEMGTEPKDEDTDRIAYQIGWKDGDEYPDFDTYRLDENTGDFICLGGGGGPNSGLLGQELG